MILAFHRMIRFLCCFCHCHGQRPAVGSIFFKRTGKWGGGGTQRLAPDISAYIAPFEPVVLWMIPLPTGIRWRLSDTSPSLGARRLNSLDPFLIMKRNSDLKRQFRNPDTN